MPSILTAWFGLVFCLEAIAWLYREDVLEWMEEEADTKT